MKYSNSIEYNISTKLDSKGLTQLKTELQKLELKLQNMGNRGLLEEKTFSDARDQIHGLGEALTEAFNPSLGILNLDKFNTALRTNDVTVQGLKTAFGQMGAEGQVAFNNLVGQLGKLDTGIIRTSSQLDKMFVTFQNTFRWGLISSFFSSFMNAIHQSVQYAKDLDDSLTQIMLVTDYSRDSMNEYAKVANEAAKAVGQTTVGMTNASLIFAQQGYDLNQSQQLATLSAKLANASQQDTAATSDQITAYMNAYGLQDNMEELAQAMDNWALIANISAADVEEIALASQRAASMANAVGVSGEALAAQIATIESVTREAPEQIGNGLKTLYARFSDLQLGKEDEDGVGLGKVTSTLEAIGVQVLDSLGNVRSMDDIMEDLMAVWQDLDDTTQEAVAQTLAGKHQVNRFIALMDNADMYQEYLGATGANAAGTLEQMNQEYMDSLQGRMATLQATIEGLFNDVFTTDMVYPLIDVLTKLAEAIDTLFKSVGGGPTVILGLATAFTRLFSKNIAQGINDFNLNQKVQQQKLANLEHSEAALTNLGMANPDPNNQYSQNVLDFAKYMQANAQKFSPDQLNQANAIFQDLIQSGNAATLAAEKLDEALSTVGIGISSISELGKDFTPFISEGIVNTTQLMGKLKDMSIEDKTKLFSDLQTKIGPAKEGLVNFNQALQEYQRQIREAKNSGQSFTGTTEQLENALKELRDYLSPELYDEYKTAIENIGESQEDAGSQTASLTGKVARLLGVLEKLQNIDLQNLDQKNLNQMNTGTAALDVDKTAKAFQEGIASQEGVQRIVNMTAAVGQLGFAIQSISNLPLIWTDENLNSSEKFLQIITNLGTVIPTLISSLKPITGLSLGELIGGTNDFNKAMKEAANASDALAEAQKKSREASAALTVAQEKVIKIEEQGAEGSATWALRKAEEAAASKVQATATEELAVAEEAERIAAEKAAAAEKALQAARWIGGITLLITAIIAAISWYQKLRQQQRELTRERVDASNELVATNKQALDNINELYDAWKETGEGADELRQALEDQAEALGIVVTAADDYDTLRQKIEEATAAQMYYNAVLRGEDYADKPKYSDNGFENFSQDTLNSLGISTDYYGTADGGVITDYQVDNYAEVYENAAARRQELLEEIQEQQADLINIDRAQNEELYQQTLAAMQANQEELDNIDSWMQENEAAYNDRYEQAQGLATGLALGNQRSFDNISWEEAQTQVQRLAENNDIELSDAQIAQLAHDALIAAGNLEAAANGMSDFVVASTALTNTNTDEINIWSDRFDNFLDGLDVSDEQKMSLFEMIDWSSDNVDEEVRNLIAQIREGLANGLSLEEIIANPNIILQPEFSWDQTDIDLDYSQEDIEKIMKEAGLEDVSLDEYLDTFLEVGGAGIVQDEVNTIVEEINSLNEQIEEHTANLSNLEKGSEAWEEENRHIERLNLQLDNANDRLKNMAIMSLQTANGMKQLSSQWKGISEDINSGVAATEAVGYQNLRPILADVLNVDSSAITQEFMQNEDVQSNIQRVAEGDMAALEKLRTQYGQINVEAYLRNEGFEGDIGVIQDLIKETENQDIEIGATLDISQYQDALREMLRSGQITAAQLQNIFHGLGYDVQIDYDVVWLPNASTTSTTSISTMMSRAKSIIGDQVGAQLGSKVGNAGSTQITTSDVKINSKSLPATPVKVPKIKFTKVGSPSGGSSGGTGGGGRGCFVAGTLVSTQDSFKEIENIKIGDIVLSYNEEIHQNEYSIVLQTMIHDVTEEIYDLYIEDEILTVTGIHRFYVRRKHNIDWIPASDLRIGDYVLFADGNWHPIFKIKIKVRSLLVYNFEVSHNHNYYVGRNQILAHNKGGGSGGGGGSSDTMEKKEPITHEEDYYEEVDSQLDQIEETLSGIEKTEDRLIGEKARQNQAKQIALLNKEIDLQRDKLKILQNQELAHVREEIANPSSTIINNLTQALSNATETEKTALKNLTKDIKIPAPEFDNDGIIKNFEKISEALDTTENNLINKYNGLIDSYNKSNSDSTKEQIEALDKIISKYEEEAGKVRENVQRYNDLQTEAQKLKNTIADLQDQIEDLRIEAYKGSLDALDKLKEINETAAGFEGILTGLNSDNPLRKITETLYELDHTFKITKADASAFLRSMQSDMVTQASKNYFENLRKNLSDSDLENGMLGFLKNELDRLRNWGLGNDKENNPFGENTQAWKETYEEVYKKLGEEVSDWESKEKDILDNLIDYYDEVDEKQQNYIDQFEHLADKMEWLKDIYSIRYGDESYQALSDIGTKQAEILKNQLTQQVHIYELWTKRYEEAVATGNEKAAKAAREIMDEAEEKMQDIAKESAETFVDAYNDAVDAAIQKMYQATIGENNLDRLDRNWEWDKKNIDGYRDEVERTFEVEQLRNKYNDLLNGAQNSSLAIQNKIREQMQEQLDLLENQKTMSEYDVKLANSKLLILQKEIALEEAQRNKNQMQLRRDSQGNYRYVYHANQNDIAKARQEYIQAVQDAYELTKQQRQKTAQELGNTLKDYAKQYADLNKNMNLSDAERALQSQELRDKFLKYMQNLQEDLMDTGYGLSDVLNSMIENGTEDMAETAQIMLDKAFDMDGNLKIGSTGIEWLDALTDYLGITYDEIEKATGDLTDQTKQDADKLSQQLSDVFSSVPDKIAEYNETIEKAEKQTDALTESTQNYLDTLEELPNKAKEALATITDYTTELKEIAKLLEDIDNTYWDLIRLNTDELPFNLPLNEYDKANNKWAPPMYTTGKFNPDNNWGRIPSEFIGGYSGEIRGHAWQAQYLDASGTWRWVISGKPVEMASGGYTGDWGKSGKLAVLHEKELVLNAQDTENIFAAVEAVRNFASSLGTNSLIHFMNSKPAFNAGYDSIEQRVEIKAEFPSVRDAFEIETALTNLADKAYQYARRKI